MGPFEYSKKCSFAIVLMFGVSEAVPYADWLSDFQDTLLVNLPVLPGSHDSGAMSISESASWSAETGWPFAQTQTLSISEQLNLGIRFLDLRLHVYYNEIDIFDQIVISHLYDSSVTLDSVLSQVSDFLSAQPTEFVVLYLRIDSAHPLEGDVAAKSQFVVDTIVNSGVAIADFTSISTIKVSAVAGKVLLLSPSGTVFPVSTSSFNYIDSTVGYSICDIWQETTIGAAQSVLSACFPIVPVSGTITNVLTGYALDGTLNNSPPIDTSLVMNDWFFAEWSSNTNWVNRKNYPIGILLINFVSETYMSQVIGEALNSGSISINDSGSSVTAKSAEKVGFGLFFVALVVVLTN